MMLQTTAFAAMTAVLVLQGWFTATLFFGRRESPWLRLALALPIAALINAVLVCLYTFAGIPLTPWSFILGHLALIAVRLPFMGKLFPAHEAVRVTVQRSTHGVPGKLLLAASAFLVGVSLWYGLAHAVLLPTFQYDSATNWAMRSEISFYDGKMAFDADEARGMAKPGYPFLFHALQMEANQFQPAWNDTAANSVHFLLTLSAFLAVWILLRRMRGTLVATVALAALFTVPLLAIHLSEGFADITLVQTLALSLAALCMAVEYRLRGGDPQRWLLLSAGMAAACVWTKAEGIQAGLLPWFIVLAAYGIADRQWRLPALRAAVVASVLSGIWVLFALTHGLSLTPHGTDAVIACHPEAVHEAVLGLFSRGSFGIAWYAVPAFTAILLLLIGTGSRRVSPRHAVTLLWGAFAFATVLFVYLCTPNVQFLLKAESYYRQLLLPLTLLIVSCAVVWKDNPNASESGDARETEEQAKA